MSYNKQIQTFVISLVLGLFLLGGIAVYFVERTMKSIFTKAMQIEKSIAFQQTTKFVSSEISAIFENSLGNNIAEKLGLEDLNERQEAFSAEMYGSINILNGSYGVTQVIVAKGEDRSIIKYSTSKEPLKFELNEYWSVLNSVIETGKRNLIQLRDTINNEPYLAALIPGEDEFEELAFVYIIVFPITTVLDLFRDYFNSPASLLEGESFIASEKHRGFLESLSEKSEAESEENARDLPGNEINWEENISKLKGLEPFSSEQKLVYYSDNTQLNDSIITAHFIILITALTILAIVFGGSFYLTNRLSDRIISIMSSLSGSVQIISSSSSNLLASSKDLVQSTEIQNQATIQSASAMEEISSMIARSDEFIGQTNELMCQVTEQVEKGLKTLSKLVINFEGLSQSIESLKKFEDDFATVEKETQAISGIAFKTNILSVNAAIEASQAGTYGIGFGVVADEVSKLAEMSNQASDKIETVLAEQMESLKLIIKNNVECSEKSSTALNANKESLDEISVTITNVVNIVKQVTAAFEEQKTAVKLVKTSLGEIKVAAVENQSTSQKNSSAANDLEKSAELLKAKNTEVTVMLCGPKAGRRQKEMKVLPKMRVDVKIKDIAD